MKKLNGLAMTFAVAILLLSGVDAVAVTTGAGASAVSAEEAPLAAKLVVGAPSSEVLAGQTDAVATLPGENVSVEQPAATAGAGSAPKVDTAKLPENEIPVLTGAKDNKKSASSGLSRILTTLGVLAALLGAAVFAIKRYASRRDNKAPGTRIRVLTQHALGPKKSLAIVQVAGESILIGVTDQNISMLKTLSLIDDEFPEAIPRNFDSALDDLDDTSAHEPRGGRVSFGSSEQEDFAVKGLGEIRDKVSTRLRNMKNL